MTSLTDIGLSALGGVKQKMSLSSAPKFVIYLAVALMIAAAIVPAALTMIATAALTSVNAGVITMFQILLPLLAVVAIVLYLLPSRQ